MTNAADLEAALRAALPPGFHPGAADLANMLAAIVAGTLAPEAAQTHMSEDPRLRSAVSALAGQTMHAGGATIQFVGGSSVTGDVGTLQQITISGGAVSGPITGSLHVTVIQVTPAAKHLPASSGVVALRRRFHALIREKTRNFVGRDFVFASIHNHLADPAFPSGYIQIIGEPGIGKTALLARLVETTGYLHHFNIATQNIRSAQAFLENVCTQLIDVYQLPYNALPARATQDSGFLVELLEAAAQQTRFSPVVLLIDALDEAEVAVASERVNRLYLPDTLPDRVHVIATTRPEDDVRLRSTTLREIFIREDDPHNQEDVRQYVRNYLAEHRDTMRERLSQWGVSEDEFVDVISTRSEGNFMYLVLVLNDIRDGEITAAHVGGSIYKLPAGLRLYYREHWRIVGERDSATFEACDKKVVCQLAAARKPVSIDQLMVWTGLDRYQVTLIIRKWRQFLNDDAGADGTIRYRIYHASFQDFLREQIGLAEASDRIIDAAFSKIAW